MNEQIIGATRFEVINHTKDFEGRVLTRYFDYPIAVSVEVQDDGKTVKVFLDGPIERSDEK